MAVPFFTAFVALYKQAFHEIVAFEFGAGYPSWFTAFSRARFSVRRCRPSFWMPEFALEGHHEGPNYYHIEGRFL